MGVAWFNLGKVQSQLGRYDEAVASYRQYLAVAPGAEDGQRVRDEIVKLEFKQELAAKEKGRAGIWIGRDGAWYTLAIDGNRMTLKTDTRPVFEDECRNAPWLGLSVPITALVHAEYQLMLRGSRLTGTWSRGPVPADKCTIPPDTAEVEGELQDKDGMMLLRQSARASWLLRRCPCWGMTAARGLSRAREKWSKTSSMGHLLRGG